MKKRIFTRSGKEMGEGKWGSLKYIGSMYEIVKQLKGGKTLPFILLKLEG